MHRNHHVPKMSARDALPPRDGRGWAGAWLGAMLCAGVHAVGRSGAWLVLATALAHATGVTAAEVSREYDLKAAFLFNFPTFVEWPAAAFAGPADPFIIGIVGDDPFGSVLDDLVRNEYTDKHPIVVRRFRRGEDYTACHLLFISESEARRSAEILRRVGARPVLTVSDLPGFAQQGGIVEFARLDNRVQLLINPRSAQGAGLTVSSKLLELAHVVNRGATSP